MSVLLVSLLLTGIVLLRRRDLTLASPALYLLLALSSLCFALLIKTLWPYYFLEPFTFLTIWWLGAMPYPAGRFRTWFRWGLALVLPGAAVVCANIREYGLTLETTPGTLQAGKRRADCGDGAGNGSNSLAVACTCAIDQTAGHMVRESIDTTTG